MSRQQREALDAMLRALPLDLGGELDVQRPLMEQLMSAHALPPDVRTTGAVLGDVPVTVIDVDGTDPSTVLLYLHGGAYALGSASAASGLASELSRRAGVRAMSVEYRLAPEHPFPAALQDTLAAYRALLARGVPALRVVLAGESAGAGLAVAMLLAIRDAGLPLPSAAVLLSPWGDLTLSGKSLQSKADADPVLTAAALHRRAIDYLAGADAADPWASPVLAELTGLPPLLIEVGSNEILLDDACRLASAAARADVAVTLTVTPGVGHVFAAFAAVLDEGVAALDRAGAFLRASLTPAAEHRSWPAA